MTFRQMLITALSAIAVLFIPYLITAPYYRSIKVRKPQSAMIRAILLYIICAAAIFFFILIITIIISLAVDWHHLDDL